MRNRKWKDNSKTSGTNNHNKNIVVFGFTLIELIVVITIISILSSYSFNFYKVYKQSQINDQEYEDARILGFQLERLFYLSDYLPNNYCKNINGGFDSQCFTSDPLLDGIEDGLCEGKIGDLELDPDCDNGCVFIDCREVTCGGNDEHYDFMKVLGDINKVDNSSFQTQSFINSISLRLCPQLTPLGDKVIGKGTSSNFETFNPSFTLYFNDQKVYNFNSNP